MTWSESQDPQSFDIRQDGDSAYSGSSILSSSGVKHQGVSGAVQFTRLQEKGRKEENYQDSKSRVKGRSLPPLSTSADEPEVHLSKDRGGKPRLPSGINIQAKSQVSGRSLFTHEALNLREDTKLDKPIVGCESEGGRGESAGRRISSGPPIKIITHTKKSQHESRCYRGFLSYERRKRSVWNLEKKKGGIS